jgi:hypothetical protein
VASTNPARTCYGASIQKPNKPMVPTSPRLTRPQPAAATHQPAVSLLDQDSMNIGEVYFSLRGDSLAPDVVTARIGIVPTRSRIKADPRPRTSAWELSSGRVTGEVVDVYDLASDLVERLAPKADAIRSLIGEFKLSATLQVVLTISADDALSTPAIGFDTTVIAFLASVGASIDVDTYRGAS